MLLFVLLLTTRFHSSISSVECYDFKGDNWFAVAEMNSTLPRWRCRVGRTRLCRRRLQRLAARSHGRLLRPRKRSVASCSVVGSASQHALYKGIPQGIDVCLEVSFQHSLVARLHLNLFLPRVFSYEIQVKFSLDFAQDKLRKLRLI